MQKDIDTIFVDLGDTFRVIRPDEEYMLQARTEICDLLGVDADPNEFYKTVIEPRYDKYREWALHFYCEAPEKVLWTRWLAYDFPKEKVEAAAGKLTYAYRRTKGERVVTEGGADTVKELTKRGYTMAIVSDLVGVHEVDEWTCFVGDNLERDIIGAKAAGLGMTIGVRYPGKKHQPVTEENKPDAFITHFTQLLDIFPPLV